LLWLKHQGFGRVISILPVMQNLSAYFEPRPDGEPLRLAAAVRNNARSLEACYLDLANSMSNKTMVLFAQ